MRAALTRHPDTPCDAVARIEAAITEPEPNQLVLRYLVTGVIGDVRLPAPAAPGRADELWRHTCFEAFLYAPDGSYFEFNFSPSTQWAAYVFRAYRERALETPPYRSDPRIELATFDDRLELSARVELVPPDPAGWSVGLSAVIEEANGRVSYWALAHPPGKPDFHHPDAFVLELPGA